MSAFNIEVDLSSAFDQLDGVAERVGEAVRDAAYQGAMVLRREVEIRAPMSEKAHIFTSKRLKSGKVGQKYLFYPGDLKRSIYIAFNKDVSVDNLKAEYWIAWRKTKPQNSGKTSVPYAHWVEFGNSRVQASPFLRPAYDSKHVEAEAKVLEILHRAVDGTANHNSD